MLEIYKDNLFIVEDGVYYDILDTVNIKRSFLEKYSTAQSFLEFILADYKLYNKNPKDAVLNYFFLNCVIIEKIEVFFKNLSDDAKLGPSYLIINDFISLFKPDFPSPKQDVCRDALKWLDSKSLWWYTVILARYRWKDYDDSIEERFIAPGSSCRRSYTEGAHHLTLVDYKKPIMNRVKGFYIQNSLDLDFDDSSGYF